MKLSHKARDIIIKTKLNMIDPNSYEGKVIELCKKHDMSYIQYDDVLLELPEAFINAEEYAGKCDLHWVKLFYPVMCEVYLTHEENWLPYYDLAVELKEFRASLDKRAK